MIKLTEDQKKCSEVYNNWDWVKNPVIMIQGIAGSGKTELTKYLLSKGTMKVPKSSVLGIAVGNLAKLTLSRQIPTCNTLAQVTGLALDFDDDADNPQAIGFVEKENHKRRADLEKVHTVVFDEVSMVDIDVMDKIKQNVPRAKKFILLGDKFQLPMIGAKGDEDSRLFDLPGYQLTQPVRQDSEDEIFKLATRVREMIKEDIQLGYIWKDIPHKAMNNGKGYALSTREKNIKSLSNSIKNGENSICVTFRNSTRQQTNYDVRKEIHGETQKKFVVGDVIISRTNHNPNGFWQRTKKGSLMYLPKGNYIMLNGERFTVLDVKEKLLKKSYLLNMYKATDYLNRNWNDVNRLKSIYSDIIGSGIWAYELVLDGCPQPINVLHEDGQQRFNEAKKQLMDIAYIHDNLNIAMQFIGKFADVNYGYASTLYSIQGQTVDKCFVDMRDIFNTTKLSNKRRLQSFYVAATRPRLNLGMY